MTLAKVDTLRSDLLEVAARATANTPDMLVRRSADGRIKAVFEMVRDGEMKAERAYERINEIIEAREWVLAQLDLKVAA